MLTALSLPIVHGLGVQEGSPRSKRDSVLWPDKPSLPPAELGQTILEGRRLSHWDPTKSRPAKQISRRMRVGVGVES